MSAAAGLVPNRATIEDVEAALLRAPNLLRRLGLRKEPNEGGWSLPLKAIGLGHYAHAFLLPNGMVLKVTDDEEDARVCKMVMDQANGKPGLPFIDAVFRLPGDVYENETDIPHERPLFAIVMEPITPANKTGLSRTEAGFIRPRMLGEAVFQPSQEALLPSNEARAFVKTIRRGVDWLVEHGVVVTDLHHGNFGYASGKRPVIMDFGHGSLQDEFIMKPIEMATNPTATLLFHGTDEEFDAPSVEATSREAIFANDDPEEAAVWGDRIVAIRLRPTAKVKELSHKKADVAFWTASDSQKWRRAGFDVIMVPADPDNREEAYRYNIWIILSDDAFDTAPMASNPQRPTEQQTREVWRALGSPRVDMNELRMGIEVEQEHGGDMRQAGKVAMDHLREFPDYYTRLTKMEARAKAGLAPNPLAEDYAFHVTLREFLDSIAKDGLLPREHASLDEPGIFFEPDEDGAAIYHEPPKTVMLRWRLPHTPDSSTPDGEYVWYKRVPPDQIEVRVGEAWQPLVGSKGPVKPNGKKLTDESQIQPFVRRASRFYHGTSKGFAEALVRQTDDVELYVTVDDWTARYYAHRRSESTGEPPVVVVLNAAELRRLGTFGGDWNDSELECERGQFVYRGPLGDAVVRVEPAVALWKKGMEPNSAAKRSGLSMSQRIFDECFDVIEERFPDFGDIELHEDEKAGSDNGAGSERQFGYCKDGDPIVIAFAAKIEKLPVENIRGLMAHEFGHALDYRYGNKLGSMLGVRLPDGVERRADAIAKAVFGETIKYDERLIQCVDCKGTSPRPRRLGP